MVSRASSILLACGFTEKTVLTPAVARSSATGRCTALGLRPNQFPWSQRAQSAASAASPMSPASRVCPPEDEIWPREWVSGIATWPQKIGA